MSTLTSGSLQLHCQSNRLIDCYPYLDISGQVQNFVAIYPDSGVESAREGIHSTTPEELRNSTWQAAVLTLFPDWNVNASTSDFVSEFGGFHPVLLEACS